MQTYEAKVMVRNGNANIAHTVRIQAASPFGAQQLLTAQYGAGNVVTTPTAVSGGTDGYNPAPWIKGF